MVQARLFIKHNPDSHDCDAIYNFMEERAMAHRDTSTLFSVDAKCNVSVGETNPFSSCICYKRQKGNCRHHHQSIVGDHDFSKISIIPDAVFVQKIPENKEQGDKGFQSSWFSGKVFYSFKNMVTQGSYALRGVVEIANVLKSQRYS